MPPTDVTASALDATSRTVALAHDERQNQLTTSLTEQNSMVGILGKAMDQLLDQGEANYDDLLQLQWIYRQLSINTTALLAVVTSPLPAFQATLLAMTGNSHPLVMD